MNGLRQTMWIAVAAVFLHLGAQLFVDPAVHRDWLREDVQRTGRSL